jgi:hypothetical protein
VFACVWTKVRFRFVRLQNDVRVCVWTKVRLQFVRVNAGSGHASCCYHVQSLLPIREHSSTGMWHWDTGTVVPSVSKDRCAYIFNGEPVHNNTWLFLPICTGSLLACCQLLNSRYSHWHKNVSYCNARSLQRKALLYFYMPRNNHPTTPRNIPEDLQLLQHHCENLKFGVVTKAPHSTFVIMYFLNYPSQNSAFVFWLSCWVCRTFWSKEVVFTDEKAGNCQVVNGLSVFHCAFQFTKYNDPTNALVYKLNSVALVRERTIPTERPPPVGEVSANFCG